MMALSVRLEGRTIKLAIESKQLCSLAGRVRTLINQADLNSKRGRDSLDILDYALGALYGLMYAAALGYEDRQGPYDPEKYSRESLLPRASDMQAGWLRVEGKWAAGLNFNSALVRMDAVHERAESLGGMKQSGPKKMRPSAEGEPAWCSDKQAHKELIKVYQEVAGLKHKPLAIGSGRKVTFEGAVRGCTELVDLLEKVSP